MKISCGVAGDLLPLYVDGCCSEESGALLTEHLGECQKCREKWERMKRIDFLPEQEETPEEGGAEQIVPGSSPTRTKSDAGELWCASCCLS